MKIAFFSKKKYEQQLFDQINSSYGHEINYFEEQLNPQTAFLSQNSEVVCVFVNDIVNAATLDKFSAGNIRLIALRCAGFNNVDVPTATKLGISVVRVPAYSPYSVAEHTVGLILTLNRKIHRAYNRVKEGNFMLDGLMGFDLHQLTVGIIGTGKIGEVVARIMRGFGCHLIAYDLHPNPECEKIGVKYVGLNELFAQSDIITLHCPLNPKTYHLINRENIAQMKPGVMLINTSRGALIHTTAVIEGLKSQKIAYLGLECIRRRRRPIFPGPLSGSHPGRCFYALAHFSQCVDYRSPGFFYPECPEQHRPNHS